MDISGIFDYERTFPLHLVNPTTEEPLGIVFNIRSAESDEAKRVQRKHIDDLLERQQRGKLIKGDKAIQREIEKAASYVASWDWGEHTYKGEKPEHSFKKACEVLSDQGWIFAQVTEAANNLQNFTTASPKPSAKRSD